MRGQAVGKNTTRCNVRSIDAQNKGVLLVFSVHSGKAEQLRQTKPRLPTAPNLFCGQILLKAS
jgi:hypothetical protein